MGDQRSDRRFSTLTIFAAIAAAAVAVAALADERGANAIEIVGIVRQETYVAPDFVAPDTFGPISNVGPTISDSATPAARRSS